ncbi:MAG: cystathionine gamma-synthase [Gemmatimonadetes bacterium GWC2_71_9]|nr:MAG: cystathionine gamma-synthase [Gemmatimonadetes bacterium GWC2_71_9]
MTRAIDRDHLHGLATRAVHAGQEPEPLAGAVTTPIFQTSTYVQEALGRNKGFEYARTSNPTRQALERNVAALEGGIHGFAFGSGMGAIHATLTLLSAGDHVVSGENVYGGTYRLMDRVMSRQGLAFSFVDTSDTAAVERAIGPQTKLLFCETPTNPMMRLADLAALGSLAASRNLVFVVDNTFATPVFQRPFDFGADVIVHSTTKYLNGHSDMVGGLAVVKRDDLAEQLAFIQKSVGAVPGPFDCWLALRGTKTLAVRMRQHDENGRRIAQWLAADQRVQRVYYPGLPSHPQHDLACRQMKGFGGMISLETGSLERARRMVASTKLFALAESLGGVESLIGHPATMTHAAVPKALRDAMGLTDGLVRLSVGIEDVDDLIADLDQALRA